MILNGDDVQFIGRLVDRVRSEHIFDSVMEDLKQNYTSYKGRWDTPARRKIGNVAREVFRQSFPNEDARKILYVEGEGTPALWRKPTKLFGSAGVYPDIAVLRPKPRRIAIELDHSERGSGLKMALAKASFNYLSDDWDNCFVLFYNQNGKLSINGKIERRICKIYEEQFHTQIFLFK